MVKIVLPHLNFLIVMIEKNIFRPLPKVSKKSLQFSDLGVEEEMIAFDAF